MAHFFAWRIIKKKFKFSQLPESLKDEVREILIDEGKGELAEE